MPRGVDAGAAQFFYRHAGYSHDPRTETAEQGRRRGAVRLARAEVLAREFGWDVQWTDSEHEWDGDEPLGPNDQLLDAVLFNAEGDEVLASLGSVVLAGTRDPYVRVVEAELADEALNEQLNKEVQGSVNLVRQRQTSPARNCLLRVVEILGSELHKLPEALQVSVDEALQLDVE